MQDFVKVACLEVAFLKIGFFGILVCNLQTSQVMSTLTSGKNSMVVRFQDLRGVSDASKLRKRADAINR